MLFLGIATIPVTYSHTVGVRVPSGGLEECREVDGPERCTICGFCKKATNDCFSCGVPRLYATHEGQLCAACYQQCGAQGSQQPGPPCDHAPACSLFLVRHCTGQFTVPFILHLHICAVAQTPHFLVLLILKLLVLCMCNAGADTCAPPKEDEELIIFATLRTCRPIS